MQLLPLDFPEIDSSGMNQIENKIRAIYRLITFSRKHLADDLLDSFLSSTKDLKELLSIKNAQMEAQNEEDARDYLRGLRAALDFVTKEIGCDRTFADRLQLFHLFRIISPVSHLEHPNRFRDTHVQVGSYMCPEPAAINGLVTELFHRIELIKNPVMRAIYFHHELIRIHPFVDGNGRVTRIAKNWMLMYDLYPPIFIKDENEKEEYIATLSASFRRLDKNPRSWNVATIDFFKQEIDRIYQNANTIHRTLQGIGHSNRGMIL